MNAIVSLCHFCELHGPSVLFCTQAFHPDDALLDTTLDDAGSSTGLGFRPSKYPQQQQQRGATSVSSGDAGTSSAPATPTGNKSTGDFCEACRCAVSGGQRGYVSHERDGVEESGGGGVVYVSSHQAHHQSVFSMLRQACVRSLSCEVCPGREGPIFFGDDHNGYVYSHTFYVKDSLARGFQRWYSIIVVMMDKIYLLNSWPFLVTYVRRLIDGIQARAGAVYAEEHVQQSPLPPSHARLVNSAGFRQVRGPIKPARSIVELTDDKQLFRKLHQAFTWLLKSGGNRLKEILLEGPPTEDSVVDLEKQELEETEDGFVMVFGQNAAGAGADTDDMELLEKDSVIKEEVEDDEEVEQKNVTLVKSLRHLLELVGYECFHTLAHHTIIGNQVIVRCAHKPLLNSLVDVLKSLLPKGCCKVISWSVDGYVDSWRCNFLGVPPEAEIPGHVELYVLVDILLLPTPNSTHNDFTLTLHSPLKLPDKVPTVLEKMEEAVCNKKLADSVLNHCLVCLKEEWMNKVKVRFMFTKAGAQSVDVEVRRLLPVLGAGREDLPVLQFWMTGLSVQYKRHMLGSAKEIQS